MPYLFKELVLDELPKDSSHDLEKSRDWLAAVTELLGFSTGLSSDQTAFVAKGVIQLSPYTYFVANRGLYLMSSAEHPERAFASGLLDYSEWAHRWGTTWALLMTAMLCLLSHVFKDWMDD